MQSCQIANQISMCTYTQSGIYLTSEPPPAPCRFGTDEDMTAFAYEVHDHLLDNEDADPESDEVQTVPIRCSSLSLAGAFQRPLPPPAVPSCSPIPFSARCLALNLWH